jgi:hypothetical protein
LETIDAKENGATPPPPNARTSQRHVVDFLLDVGERLSTRASYFFPVLALFQLWLTRRVFASGLLADIDSVCHVSYLRYLTDEFYPQTGALFGFTPKFNGGAPFLLYNVPPGVYLLALPLVKVGLSAGFAIKVLLSLAYYANSAWAWMLGRELDATPNSKLPAISAFGVGLFSSDLFGLEFYFKNGMVNPCVALPLVGFAAVAFLRAIRTTGYKCILHTIGLGVIFTAIVLTHILSAYFCVLLFACMLLTSEWKVLGRRTAIVAVALVLGGLLSAFWLYPSIAFAPKEDPAYIWVRHPGETLSAIADGSLFSSYFGGFAESYRIVSNHSLILVICAIVGAIQAARTKNRSGLAFVAFFLVSLVVSLGPNIRLGTQFLPGYQRLLWYRFVTPVGMATVVLSGYGCHTLLQQRTGAAFVRSLISAGTLVSVFLLNSRATRIRTDNDFGSYRESYEQVSGWLKANAAPRSRVFSEFFAIGAVEPPSVNYVRQLVPVDSGLSEVGGWVYETSPIAAHLIRQGSFWHATSLLADQAKELCLHYVIVGTPASVRAFETDRRWKAVVRSPDLIVFESLEASELRLATAGKRAVVALDEHYNRGGGYQYRYQIGQSVTGASAESILTMRINATAGWHAYANGSEVKIQAGDDGMMRVSLPEGACELQLVFDIGAEKSRGAKLSGLGILLVACGLILGRLKIAANRLQYARTTIETGGKLVLGLGVISVIVLGTRAKFASVGFGIPGGIRPVRSVKQVALATDQARQQGGAIREVSGASSREFALSFGNQAKLLVRPKSEEPRRMTITAPNGKTCERQLAPGEDTIDLPSDCGGKADPTSIDFGPGMQAHLRVEGADVSEAELRDDIEYVQAEEFQNSLEDAGNEASLSPGSSEIIPQNGQTVYAFTPREGRISLFKERDFAEGNYDVWILAESPHPRLLRKRANIELEVNGTSIGATNGSSVAIPSEYWRTSPVFRWIYLGTSRLGQKTKLQIHLKSKQSGTTAVAEIDALAFVRTGSR